MPRRTLVWGTIVGKYTPGTTHPPPRARRRWDAVSGGGVVPTSLGKRRVVRSMTIPVGWGFGRCRLPSGFGKKGRINNQLLEKVALPNTGSFLLQHTVIFVT